MKTLNRRWKLIVLGAFALMMAIGGMKAKARQDNPAGNSNVAAVLCVRTDEGVPRGPLQFRDACSNKELQLGKFEGRELTFSVPLGPLNVSTNLGVPGVIERSDQTTYQTPMFEATTDPNGSADIIDGVIEEGSVYHHDVTLIARTADGRAWSGGWGYLVAHRVGSQSIEIFSKQNESQGSINPAPTSEVLAVGNRRILRVHGNGQDTLQWSAVVQRVKILPPGR
jgi:hypothetical protein